MRGILSYSPSRANRFLENRWPGYKVIGYQTINGILHIELQPRHHFAICPFCGKKCYKLHARQQRQALDASFYGHQHCVIAYKAERYRCSCGHTCTQQPVWIEPRARVTNALVYTIQLLLREPSMTIKTISHLTGLSWPTIRKIDKMQLQYFFSQMDLTGVQNLAIDEFSVEKGHKYATVVIDNDRCRVLWVGKGKSIKAVAPFFEELRKRGLADKILSVACDQNAAYPQLIQTYLPRARIVYDLFHVLYNFRREVLAEARKQSEIRVNARLKAEGKKANCHLTGADWLMVIRHDDLEGTDKKKLLESMLNDNELLAALYPIVDAIRRLWTIRDKNEANRLIDALARLCNQIASRFKFKPIRRFARMLKRRREGIIYAGYFGFATNRLEGANNKIKVLKRTAYGYRDFEYFALKIKSILPGKGFYNPYDKLRNFAVIYNRLWLGVWNDCCLHANL